MKVSKILAELSILYSSGASHVTINKMAALVTALRIGKEKKVSSLLVP